MAQFNWQTEEEGSWEELPEFEPPLPPTRRRFYWILLIVLSIVAAVAGVGYWQAQQRVKTVEAAIRADVLSSHALQQQAALAGDAELLQTAVSGEDPAWLAAQLDLLQADLLANRWALGLQAKAEEINIVSVTIAPSLTEAEVVWQRPFTATWRNGETVLLEQTAVYRQGEQRWLHAPFDNDFWGDWDTIRSNRLSATFTNRDADIVERLLLDLDKAAAPFCQIPPVPTCGFRLRFSINEQDFVQLPSSFTERNGTTYLQLPSPTLVGMPVDDAAYEQLLAGYQLHLLAMLMNAPQRTDRCCQQGNLFHYALMVRELVELDYLPASFIVPDYEIGFQNPVAGLAGLDDYWSDWWEPASAQTLFPIADGRVNEIQSVLDYLQWLDPNISWSTLRQRLNEAEDYQAWLQKYVPVGGGFGGNREQQRKWLRFVQARFPQTAVAPAAGDTTPAQDIQLLCSEGNGRRANLLRYDMVTGDWEVELTDRTLLFMAPLPDDSGIFLQERQPRLDRTQGIIWQAGVERPALRQPMNAGLFRVDPLGADFLLYAFNFSERETTFGRVELDNCTTAGCAVATYESLPAWSPNGRFRLQQQSGEFLWLQDQTSGQESFISTGFAPFWLDNTTFGFVLPTVNEAGEMVEHVMVSNLEGDVLVYQPLTRFLTAVPPQALLTAYTIHDIVPNPQNEAELLIALMPRDEADTGSFVLAYNFQQQQTRHLLSLPHDLSPLEPLRFSPDGRWLTVQSFARRDANWELHVYDLLDGQTAVLRSNYVYTLPGYDWSADGEWLLRVDDGFIHLHSPKQQQSRLLVHDYPRCNFAAWVNRR